MLLELLLFANCAAPAHADELPLKVQLGTHSGTPQAIPQLYILSTADHIEIRSLKVNGGNCDYFTDRQFYLPIALTFGQQVVVILRSSCHVLEAEIDTDQGSQTYSFDPTNSQRRWRSLGIASAKERGEAVAESDWSDAKRSTPSINEAVKKMNEAFDCHKGRVLTPERASLSRYCEDHGWWNGITETLELIGYSNRFWALTTPWKDI
jgi:hypothetical protein